MATEIHVTKQQAVNAAEQATTKVATTAEALALAVEQVRMDSRKESRRYLDETVAKYGGE